MDNATQPVKEYAYHAGRVVSYDPVRGVADVRIKGQDQLGKFHIGAYSSGRPSRPPIVGELVSVKVCHQPTGESIIVAAWRIAD